LAEVFKTNGDSLLNPKYNPEKRSSEEYKYFCPNYFTMVCQEGLILPEEVSEVFPYAGLKWITDTGKIKTKIRKKLHNKKQDLTKPLLKKFYYNSNFYDYIVYEFIRDFKKLKNPSQEKLDKLIKEFIVKSKLTKV